MRAALWVRVTTEEALPGENGHVIYTNELQKVADLMASGDGTDDS